MRRKTTLQTLIIVVLLGLFPALEAVAWGADARTAITRTAIHMVRRVHAETFKPGDQTYDRDVVRGAHAGVDALRGISPPMTEREAIDEVGRQIQILRGAREEGTGSYFAYRMGALGSLVADLMFPYGIPRTEDEEQLAQQITQDVDDHLREFSFQARRAGRKVIDIPTEYFRYQRAFHREAMQIIATDYRQRQGYDGYLNNAAPRLFSSSIEAVADAWHTVLRQEPPLEGQPPSREELAWYYTDEIDYLLNVRGNRREADRAYRKFEQANPGLYAPYEEIGDAFYVYGEHDRAVHEWEYALNLEGADRRRVAGKLAGHFMDMGLRALGTAERDPDEREDALDRADMAFRNVLRYAPRNEEAPELLGEVNAMMREREEQLRMVTQIMSGAESVLAEARSNVDAGDYGAAFSAFFRSRELYQSVDDDFPDHYNHAQDRLREIEVAVRRAVEGLLDDAYETLADGDNALDAQNFDEARQYYRQAQDIVQEIPVEEDEAFAEDQDDLLEEAEERLEEVDIEEEQWERQQQLEAEEAEGAAPF